MFRRHQSPKYNTLPPSRYHFRGPQSSHIGFHIQTLTGTGSSRWRNVCFEEWTLSWRQPWGTTSWWECPPQLWRWCNYIIYIYLHSFTCISAPLSSKYLKYTKHAVKRLPTHTLNWCRGNKMTDDGAEFALECSEMCCCWLSTWE